MIKWENSQICIALLIVNVVLFILHMQNSNADLSYFCQLTVLAQTLVIFNFAICACKQWKDEDLIFKVYLSRLHLITFSMEAVVTLGFWSLRIFFTEGIIPNGEERSYYDEILSFYIHGGSFITMFYFIKTDQIILERNIPIKCLYHALVFSIFIAMQILKWYKTGTHVYGFIGLFNWTQLIVFECGLFMFSILLNYIISIRHGLNKFKHHQPSSPHKKKL